MENLKIILIFTVLQGLLFYRADTGLVEIDISAYDPENEKTHSYHDFIENFDVNITEIVVKSNSTKQQGFFILQAHSSHYNVSLRNYDNKSATEESHNTGMVQFFMTPFTSSFYLEKQTPKNITILITVTVYDNSAPIPGGCSESINITDMSPTIKVVDGQEIIRINIWPPSLKGFSCNAIQNDTVVDVYHKFLPGQNFGNYNYYLGILSMLTVQDIQKNGRLVSRTKGHSNLKKMFSSYIGVGEVFSVIVTINGISSAYIPSISFGEDINILIENNEKGTSGFYFYFFSVLPVVAIVIIYRGHTFFHFTTFVSGTCFGMIISLFMLNHDGSPIGDNTLIVECFLIGLLFGVVWLGVWYKCGFPLLSASIAFLQCSVLLSCTIYHLGVADHELLHSDTAYWMIFFGIIAICFNLLSVISTFGHIIACAILGSYILALTTLNQWMDGNMHYIIINVVRRMYVPNFNEAILDPPYQPRDVVISFIQICFTAHGLWRQLRNQIGKPPFPAHNSRYLRGEYAPLL